MKNLIFNLIWNAILHALTLSVLLFWSNQQPEGTPFSQLQKLNSGWAQHRFLFALIPQVLGLFIFRDRILNAFHPLIPSLKTLLASGLRGLLVALLFSFYFLRQDIESSQQAIMTKLFFQDGGVWILNTLEIIAFIAVSEFLLRVPPKLPLLLAQGVVRALIYVLWLEAKLPECLVLVLFSIALPSFLESIGFLSLFFGTAGPLFGIALFADNTPLGHSLLSQPELILALILAGSLRWLYPKWHHHANLDS